MNFIPLASSSRGNAYLLKSEGAAPLLLEAGLPIKQLRDKLREVGVNLSDLVGCLISHEHGDHSKAVNDLLKAGVDCFMSTGTAMALQIYDRHRCFVLRRAPNAGNIEHWHVTTFNLQHDAHEPIGFLIAHGNDRLLFIPDTAYVENRFQGVTMISVECNNISEILSRNILEGNLPAVVGRRVRRNHMSLETLIAMLKANDLSLCRQIFLMHLSDGNSDERRMKKEVQQATGIPTVAC